MKAVIHWRNLLYLGLNWTALYERAGLGILNGRQLDVTKRDVEQVTNRSMSWGVFDERGHWMIGHMFQGGKKLRGALLELGGLAMKEGRLDSRLRLSGMTEKLLMALVRHPHRSFAGDPSEQTPNWVPDDECRERRREKTPCPTSPQTTVGNDGAAE